jgi:hypothetical protein
MLLQTRRQDFVSWSKAFQNVIHTDSRLQKELAWINRIYHKFAYSLCIIYSLLESANERLFRTTDAYSILEWSKVIYEYCYVILLTIEGFGLVTGFTEHLQIVTTSNYSAVANSHTLQFTTARTNSSQSAMFSPVAVWWRIPTTPSTSVLTFLSAEDCLITKLLWPPSQDALLNSTRLHSTNCIQLGRSSDIARERT